MKRIINVTISILLLATLIVPAFAADDKVTLFVNDVTISPADVKLVNGVPYVTAAACLPAGSKSCEIQADGEVLQTLGGFAKKQVYAIVARVGDKYVNVNGRYLYVKNKVQQIDGKVALPLSTYAKIFGGTATRSTKKSNTFYLKTGSIDLTFGSDFYNDRVVHTMARTIYSEAGNQALEGKIAVGNVIVNRVLSPKWPNNITDVVLARNQFTGTLTHYFYEEPPESCVIAAKIALEGVEIFPGVHYFNQKDKDTWASRNCKYLGTLGGHDFYR